jgi:hypothetical protein
MFKLVCVCLVATALAAGESGTALKKEAFNKHSTDNNHKCVNAVNCFDHETGKNFRGCNTDLKIGEVSSRGGAQWCDIVECKAVKEVATIVPAYKNAKTGAQCHGSAIDWLDCENLNAQQCATEWTMGNCDDKVTCAWVKDNKRGNMHKYTANKKNSGNIDGPTANRRLVTRIAPGAEGLEHQCLVVPGQQIDAEGIACQCFCRPKQARCKKNKLVAEADDFDKVKGQWKCSDKNGKVSASSTRGTCKWESPVMKIQHDVDAHDQANDHGYDALKVEFQYREKGSLDRSDYAKVELRVCSNTSEKSCGKFKNLKKIHNDLDTSRKNQQGRRWSSWRTITSDYQKILDGDQYVQVQVALDADYREHQQVQAVKVLSECNV